MAAALIPYDYVRAVELAGARALLVPPSEDGVEETLDAVDGLIFSGGSDLDPELYGQEAHPETDGVVTERDRAELALLQAALARDMPVLAICRGSQVLNVARGGDVPRRAQRLAATVQLRRALTSRDRRRKLVAARGGGRHGSRTALAASADGPGRASAESAPHRPQMERSGGAPRRRRHGRA